MFVLAFRMTRDARQPNTPHAHGKTKWLNQVEHGRAIRGRWSADCSTQVYYEGSKEHHGITSATSNRESGDQPESRGREKLRMVNKSKAVEQSKMQGPCGNAGWICDQCRGENR